MVMVKIPMGVHKGAFFNKNTEYRTRNFEYRWMESLAQRRRLRRVSLCLFMRTKMIEYLRSTFIIRKSAFDILFL